MAIYDQFLGSGILYVDMWLYVRGCEKLTCLQDDADGSMMMRPC